MITEKQLEFYNKLTEFIDTNGYTPTVREMCEFSGLSSPATVHSHLKKLEEAGYISKGKNKSRSITVKNSVSYTSVPVIGTVTAGVPILAYENIEGYLPVSADISKGRELFILKVKGDSMIEKGIFNGDKLIVKQTNYAEDGEIVVALIDDSATVKTLKKEKDGIMLIPANPSYKPIKTNSASILGVAVGLIREF